MTERPSERAMRIASENRKPERAPHLRNVSRRELEISTGWAAEFPELCISAVYDFTRESGWKYEAPNKSRKGFVTLVATRNVERS